MRVLLKTTNNATLLFENLQGFDLDESNGNAILVRRDGTQKSYSDIKMCRATDDTGGSLYEWSLPKVPSDGKTREIGAENRTPAPVVNNLSMRFENVENFRASQGQLSENLKRSVTMAMQQDPTKRVSTSDVKLTLTEDGAELFFALMAKHMRLEHWHANPLRETYNFLTRGLDMSADEAAIKWKEYLT